MTYAKPAPSKTAQKVNLRNQNQSKFLWAGIGTAVLLFVALSFIVSRLNALPFKFVSGEEAPLILLRNTTDVQYQLEVTGSNPVTVERVVPMIQTFQGQVMYVDIEAVQLAAGGEPILLAEGGVMPAGTTLVLQPGDTLDITVTYLGQTLGHNRVYGFRLGYNVNGRSGEADLEIEGDYYVFVE